MLYENFHGKTRIFIERNKEWEKEIQIPQNLIKLKIKMITSCLICGCRQDDKDIKDNKDNPSSSSSLYNKLKRFLVYHKCLKVSYLLISLSFFDSESCPMI
jgi:hypothetical protein